MRYEDESTASARPVFAGLFDDLPVAVQDLWFDDEAPTCHPLEAAQTLSAVAARRLEHAAGRQCARRALAGLDIQDFVLLNDGDRCPIWPVGVVGSITHTGGSRGSYGAAAVARNDGVSAIGIDAEDAAPLDPALWELVATPTELRACRRAGALAGLHAKVLFSAKESYYKAQFPLTRRLLDFREVEIELDTHRRRFAVIAVLDEDPPRPLARCTGRFEVTDRHVHTACIAMA